jgi:hypothetical protein
VVIHGDCRGADRIADAKAKLMGLTPEAYPAKWREGGVYRPQAGPERNQRMLDEGKPELVLTFHDDLAKSKGTKDMMRRAEKAGVRVVVYGTKPSATRSLLRAQDDM